MRSSTRFWVLLVMLCGRLLVLADPSASQAPVALDVRVSGTAGIPTVTWKSIKGATQYTVERWMLNQPSCCRNSSAVLTGTSWTDSPLPQTGTYMYRVTVRFPDGNAGYSEQQFDPAAATGAPGAPSGPAAGSAAAAGAKAGAGAATVGAAVPGGSVISSAVNGGRAAAGAAAAGGADPLVNPSGFSATQTGDGEVRLEWKPVRGISTYLLLGPGLPRQGLRVTGATTHLVGKLPFGAQRWLLGSLDDQGHTTAVTDFTPVDLTVGKPH